jgi:hypothetical protein
MPRIGFDIEGTFTDFAVWRRDAGGDIAIYFLHGYRDPSPGEAAAIEGDEPLVEQPDATVLVPHGFVAEVAAYGDIVLPRGA